MSAPQGAVPPNTLMVGISADGKEVVINHPHIQPDEHGAGYITFSPDQARNLARLLVQKAYEIQGVQVKGIEVQIA